MKTNSRELRQKRIELGVHNYERICRYCTEESFLRPILLPPANKTEGNNVFNDERQIGMLLSTYLQYDLEQEIGLPKYICDDCIDTLSRWHRFQVRYVTTTEDLRHALEQIDRQQLQQHIRVNYGENPFECPQCSKRFRSRNNLRQHIRSHLNVKPFRCASCAMAYSNKQSLFRHENSSKCSRSKLGASEAAAGT